MINFSGSLENLVSNLERILKFRGYTLSSSLDQFPGPFAIQNQ
jgi:hypothetical protein